MSAERLTRIRERAKQHGEALESVTWFTPAQLAARWNVSTTTVYLIPAADLPYKRFGKGKHPHRRYSPSVVVAFESTDDAKQSA